MKNEIFKIGSQIIQIEGRVDGLPPTDKIISRFSISSPSKIDLTVYINCQSTNNASDVYKHLPMIYKDKYGMCIYSDGNKYHYEFVKDEVNYISAAYYDVSSRTAQIYIIPSNIPNNYIHLLYTTPFQLVYMQHLAFHSDSYLVHTSAISSESGGICLCGKSGAGKTTISSLFSHNSQYKVLTDETALLEFQDGEIDVYGTPWKGSGSMFARNESIELRRIYFISHARDKNYSERVDIGESANQLLQQAFPYYWDKKAMTSIFIKILRTVKIVECYSLAFIPDKSVVQYIEEHLTGE